MIDTHAHLDACELDPHVLVSRAQAVGVERVLSVGSGLDSCRATLAIAEREPAVAAILGVHPHQATDDDAARLDELRELLRRPQAVAVGEIGLDYYRDHAPPDAQRALFEAQLELAADLGLPVAIHTRAAEEDTLAALAGFAGTVVLHCFSSPAMLEQALERGYYVSFAGNVTFPKADDLREAARAVPADRLLVETDSPYLAPQPVRGQSNEPSFVLHTVVTLARVRGEPVEELGARTAANARAAFSLQ